MCDLVWHVCTGNVLRARSTRSDVRRPVGSGCYAWKSVGVGLHEVEVVAESMIPRVKEYSTLGEMSTS